MIQDNRRAGTKALSSQHRLGFARVAIALIGLLSGCSRWGSTPTGGTLQIAFIRPVDGQQLTLADETDPSTPGFQADIQLQAQDTTGRTLQALTAQLQVRLSSDQTWTLGPAAQISGTSITFPKVTLPGGVVALQATVSEPATQRSTTQNITINVPVVHAPTIQFTSPIASTYSTRVITVSALVSGEAAEGRPVDIYDQLGIGVATKIGTLTVRNGQISGPLVFANGTHIVSGNIVDAIGNPGTASVSNVVVAAVGCSVVITRPPNSPVYLGRNDDEDPVTPGLQYTLRGVSLDCLGVAVQLLKGTNPTPIGTTTTNPTTGAFSFYITLLDGEQTRLTARMTDPNSGGVTSSFVDVTVKLTPPVISNIIPPQSNLFCVANSNYHLYLSPPTPGYIQDKVPDGDCEADFSFTVSGGAGGVASLVYRGTTLQQQPITSDPQTLNFINAVLTQNTSGQLQFQATDIAGNTAATTANITVDVIPPAPSTFTLIAIPDGGARVATVNLAWTATGAHGDAGTPVGYDLRWSTNAVLPGTLVDGGYVDGGIRDDPTYFDLTKVVQVSGAPLPPSTLSYQLTPLPPLASYSIQVRALNAIGNYARISPQADLNNFLSTVALLNPVAAATGFGAHLAKADFNVDGADDLVVGASLIQPGAVWIYYGSPSFGTAPPQQLTPSDGQAGNFGLDFSVGDVGNPVGSLPAPDLLIGQNTWSLGRGRAFLYFGRPGAQIDPATFVEFRGTNLPTPAGGFGGSARIIADINGDGLGEVLISAQRESSNVGKVFLFYGRSQAQWMAARVPDPVDGVLSIQTSAADRVFTGDGPPDNFFGRLRGYADLGDLTGDGGYAFTIPASLDNVNNVFIYPGPTVNGRGDGGIVAVTDTIQVLHRDAVTDAGTLFGFGYEAVGKANFVGGPANDLVVSLPRNNQVLIYPDGTMDGGFTLPPRIVSSINGNFGASLSYGDINLDGRPDIVVGENASGYNQQAWIFYNRGTPGTEFDSNAGAGFFQSRLVGPRALGIGVVVGDFNGDGRPDVAAGDNLDGNGKVTVWY